VYVVERNMDADKCAYRQSKEYREERKLIIRRHIQDEGSDAIKKCLDDLFNNALFGSDSTLTKQNQEAHQDRKIPMNLTSKYTLNNRLNLFNDFLTS